MRRSNEALAGDVIRELLEQLNYGDRMLSTQIQDKWSEIVGQKFASYTSGMRMNHGRLYVNMTSAAAINELTIQRTQILTRITQLLELKPGTVKEVFFN